MSKQIEIGMPMRGFRFDGEHSPGWNERMEDYIGKTGTIKSIHPYYVSVEFEDGEEWAYPLSMVAEHLVKESHEGTVSGEAIDQATVNNQ